MTAWRPVASPEDEGIPDAPSDSPSVELAESTKSSLRQHPTAGWPSYHEIMRRVAVLEAAPVFFALPDRILRALARRLRRITVTEGEMVACQDEPGDTIFFIERGRCRVVFERPPDVITVAVLNEGSFFGEVACLLNRPHAASVYSQTNCSLMALDRRSLLAVVGQDHPIIDSLTRAAGQNLNQFSRAIAHAGLHQPDEEAFVVGVYSPRGGSGATTVAMNLVSALAGNDPGQVLLLDLDLPYAHAALLAGLVPVICLARLGTAPQDVFEDVLLSAVLYHSGGAMILEGVLRPEEVDKLTPALISRTMAALRKKFRYIVVDLSPVITEPILAALDSLNQVVVVTAADLSAAKSAADAIGILLELGIPDGRLTVVLNNRSSKPALGREGVERLIKRKVDVEVGYDRGRPEAAALKGEILSLVRTRSEVARAAVEICDLLEGRRVSRAAGAP